MAVNKVVYSTTAGDQTLIDLTGDTAAVESVFEGEVFHGADGEIKTGTFTIQPELTEQNALIEQIKAGLQGKAAGGGSGGSVIDFLAQTLTEINDTQGAVTSISAYMFDGNTAIETVRLPAVTSIGAYNFRNCENLVTIDLPELTGSTGTYFAASCDKLVNVNIPKATSLGQYSMRYCYALEVVDLPCVESIVNYSFTGSSKLHTLILRSTKGVVSSGGSAVLSATAIAKGNGYIYVPAALVDSYKTATNWSTYANRFRAIEDYPDITGGDIT